MPHRGKSEALSSGSFVVILFLVKKTSSCVVFFIAGSCLWRAPSHSKISSANN